MICQLTDGKGSASASTRPGARLPHVWLVDEGGLRVSTLDIMGRGQFLVVTGLSGGVWQRAAAAVQAELGLPVRQLTAALSVVLGR